ncbi:Meckel syndrome type 1 protein [Elysia marginata]|uniref:Meckel syndrome type 1 protein n=1 Tax=Elysia marginata TaxID=1093978 RepID=A0AAV4JW05_9GAST|nr:Meckel syndrome type 1 protein [Elysia marginata]
MAGFFEPDCGTAYYRSNDPIKNLKIKVTLKRVSASFAEDGQESTVTATESGVELANLGERKNEKSRDAQECVIGWQQKVFCQREIEFYSKSENCENVLDRKYHQDVTAYLKKRPSNNMIFSYVDHDDFSHQQEGFSSMTNHMEEPNALAAKMSQVRCRRIGGRQLREKDQGSIPKTLIVEEEPSEDMRQRNHLEAPPIQVMYIMADLSPADR